MINVERHCSFSFLFEVEPIIDIRLESSDRIIYSIEIPLIESIPNEVDFFLYESIPSESISSRINQFFFFCFVEWMKTCTEGERENRCLATNVYFWSILEKIKSDLLKKRTFSSLKHLFIRIRISFLDLLDASCLIFNVIQIEMKNKTEEKILTRIQIITWDVVIATRQEKKHGLNPFVLNLRLFLPSVLMTRSSREKCERKRKTERNLRSSTPLISYDIFFLLNICSQFFSTHFFSWFSFNSN